MVRTATTTTSAPPSAGCGCGCGGSSDSTSTTTESLWDRAVSAMSELGTFVNPLVQVLTLVTQAFTVWTLTKKL